MTIDEDGPPCQGHCNNRGCLEVLASATGSCARPTRGQPAAGRYPGGHPGDGEELDARLIIERARSGYPESLQVLEMVGRNLGIGIAN